MGGGRRHTTFSSQERDFDPNSPIIKFDSKSQANDFIGKMDRSIRIVFSSAEEEFRKVIGGGVQEFVKNFEKHRDEAIFDIKKSIQKNIDGLDIDIPVPSANSVNLGFSLSQAFSDSIEEKSKSVTKRRRSSGTWGTVCRWFNTDDWGWEEYSVRENFYEVNIVTVNNSIKESSNVMFIAASDVLKEKIEPHLKKGVGEFFTVFREKVEHVRGDLMMGIQAMDQEKSKQKSLLMNLQQMAKKAVDSQADSETLNASAEQLRKQAESAS